MSKKSDKPIKPDIKSYNDKDQFDILDVMISDGDNLFLPPMENKKNPGNPSSITASQLTENKEKSR